MLRSPYLHRSSSPRRQSSPHLLLLGGHRRLHLSRARRALHALDKRVRLLARRAWSRRQLVYAVPERAALRPDEQAEPVAEPVRSQRWRGNCAQQGFHRERACTWSWSPSQANTSHSQHKGLVQLSSYLNMSFSPTHSSPDAPFTTVRTVSPLPYRPSLPEPLPPHPYAHHARSLCLPSDLCVFHTNIALLPPPDATPYPGPEQVGSLQRWEEHLGWVARGWTEGDELWREEETWARRWAYQFAVDGDVKTAFRSPNGASVGLALLALTKLTRGAAVVRAGDYIALSLLAPLDAAWTPTVKVHVILEDAVKVLGSGKIRVEVSLDGHRWVHRGCPPSRPQLADVDTTRSARGTQRRQASRPSSAAPRAAYTARLSAFAPRCRPPLSPIQRSSRPSHGGSLLLNKPLRPARARSSGGGSARSGDERAASASARSRSRPRCLRLRRRRRAGSACPSQDGGSYGCWRSAARRRRSEARTETSCSTSAGACTRCGSLRRRLRSICLFASAGLVSATCAREKGSRVEYKLNTTRACNAKAYPLVRVACTSHLSLASALSAGVLGHKDTRAASLARAGAPTPTPRRAVAETRRPRSHTRTHTTCSTTTRTGDDSADWDD